MEISAAVIAMAHKLKLKVIAEGVETEEQWEFLKQNRCDVGQGFMIGEPLMVKDFFRLRTDKKTGI
jgi:EAL domain-containing protein (putative c-di-GMP-specific phosphodiesterase class I)